MVQIHFPWPFTSSDLTHLKSTTSTGTIYLSVDMQPLQWREMKLVNNGL